MSTPNEIISHNAVLDQLQSHCAALRAQLTCIESLMPVSLYSSSREQMRIRAAVDDMSASLCYIEASVHLAERHPE